ncbi:MAG: NosD domain-containing protein [Candidatus Lokiarchaeota archaeon]
MFKKIQRKNYIVYFIILFFLMLGLRGTTIYINLGDQRKEIKNPNFGPKINFDQNHDSITILGNNQFTSEKGVTKGNGSITSPYIIENWIINGENSSSNIYIFYTTAYFIIRNCTLFNGTNSDLGGGIKLEQVKNGLIYNNTIVSNNGNGISLIYNSCNNSIKENIIKDNRKFGIFNYYNSNNTIIKDNTIENNNFEGIEGYFSSGMKINHNIFKDNREGIYLESNEQNCVISQNFFLINTQNTATDNGQLNTWYNNSLGNYWFDYDGRDLDNNGVGEDEYMISGDANNKDPYPLVYPDDDNDGLDNILEELYYHTNSSDWDTDNDNYSDKVEVDYGTDPLNSSDYPYNAFTPLLSNVSLNKQNGFEHTYFEFFVNYSDYDNNSPNYINITIDGKSYSMNKNDFSDNNYIDGCSYSISMRLSEGSHEYFIKCHDGIHYMETKEYYGPVVNKTLMIIQPLNQTYTQNNIEIKLRNNYPNLNQLYYKLYLISKDAWIYPSNGTLFTENLTVNLQNGKYYLEFFASDTTGDQYSNSVYFTINAVSHPNSSIIPIIIITIVISGSSALLI